MNAKDVTQPIINNINLFYDNKMIQGAINSVRNYLIIKNKLSDEAIDRINKITDIDKLVENLIENWINESFNNEITRQDFIKKTAKEILLHEGANERLNEKEFNDVIENISLMEIDGYLRRQLDSYKLRDSYLVFPARVNLNIWGKVLDAILLGAPEKNILNCRQSIYKKYYLPSAYCEDGKLLIEINELTTQDDVISVWKKVEKLKIKYTKQRQHIISERKRANLKIDRTISALCDQGKKPKEISNILYEQGYKNITAKQVSDRIKEIEKFTERKSFKKRF